MKIQEASEKMGRVGSVYYSSCHLILASGCPGEQTGLTCCGGPPLDHPAFVSYEYLPGVHVVGKQTQSCESPAVRTLESYS